MTTITLPQEVHQPGRPRLRITESGLKRALRRVPDFVANVVLQRRVLQRPYAGVMHLLLFWGVTVQLLGTATNLLQMRLFTPFVVESFPRGSLYLGYELIMDLAGVAILAGVAMALFRRFVMRPASLESRWDDYLSLGLLTLIPTLGFGLEALRLVAFPAPWSVWSPVGNALAVAFRGMGLTPDTAVSWHTLLFWVHAALGLALVASLPFTKMRHVITIPLHIALRPDRGAGQVATIYDLENAEFLGVGSVREFCTTQLLSFDACVRCGRCEDVCPVTACGSGTSPRTLVQRLRETMVGELVEGNGHEGQMLIGQALAEDTPWHCTTCGACVSRCPAFVNPVDAMVDLRRYQVMTTGRVPKEVVAVLRNFERRNNPWGLPGDDRAERVRALDVRALGPGEETDTLLFLGCALTYDDRNGRSARALVDLLNSSGTDFAVLGGGELCCGESARRMGNEYLFQEMARANLSRLDSVRFRRIVTACPHCYNTMKNEYPDFGSRYEVRHYVEVLSAVDGGALPSGSNGNGHTAPVVGGTVVYHDSCYLGRYNGIYDAPRAILDHAGVERIELPRHGHDSFCCGGGGGQMWMEVDPAHRLNLSRLDEAVAAGADVVATACPYCLLMLDDAVRSRGLTDRLRVLDVAEVLAANLPSAEPARMEVEL